MITVSNVINACFANIAIPIQNRYSSNYVLSLAIWTYRFFNSNVIVTNNSTMLEKYGFKEMEPLESWEECCGPICRKICRSKEKEIYFWIMNELEKGKNFGAEDSPEFDTPEKIEIYLQNSISKIIENIKTFGIECPSKKEVC